MKLNFNKTLPTSLVITVSLLLGCVDNEKDFYDPTYRAKNPMGEIVAPEDFDWLLTSPVKLTVNVSDEGGDRYYYVIDVFDENPILSSTAHLLDKGVARKREAFSTEVSVPKAVQTIYIRQTTPTGLSSVRAYETTSGTIDCNFGRADEPATTRSTAMTRGFVDMKAPDRNDTNLFPKSAPKGVKLFDSSTLKAGESYEVKSNTKQLNLGGTQHIKLYVTENLNLNSEIYLTAHSTMYILPGVTVTMPQATNNGQSNCLISVGEGASFITPGTIQLDSDYKLYNLGTVSASNVSCTNNSYFYNGGVAKITNKLSGENGGGSILNEGDLTAADITMAGNSHMINRKNVKASNTTTVNSTNASWENSGEWITENMNISAWNSSNINRCKLIVNKLLHLQEAKLINDGDSYIRCSTLYMTNTLVELGAKSLFVVTEQATYRYHADNSHGFKGTGNKMALLTIKKAIAELPGNNNMIHYSGNLQVVCTDHPEKKVDDWNIRWTMTSSIEWTHSPTIEIKKTGCNEGSDIQPTPPTNPDFPILVEPNEKYSLMFEDQWPLYGDYDMNDIVLDLKGLKYSLDEKNETDQVSFTVTLQAVGALRAIAAAVMLDKINATEIASVDYGQSPRPTTFDIAGNGMERNQQFAVIPLFDDAHQIMGKRNGNFINTQSGGSDNVGQNDYPKIELTIKLKNKVSKSYFNINQMNFFIIADKATKRKEVHMAGYKPSNLANTRFFGMNDDNSSGGKYYVSKENLAWGIIVPQQFKWPLEHNNIKDVYVEFEGWITSGGTKNKKWYNNFDNEKTFQNNKN